MTEAKARLIVVLGMHRSGTSAVTKSLELMGVGLGDNLLPANFSNTKGFWEDRECLAINDKLLSHLDVAWDRLGLAWDEIREDPRVDEWMATAIEIVSRKLDENNGIWGFKDPRTCRLLVFWHRVFLAVKCEVCVVMAVRNPASVAASLAARDGIQAQKAYYLWLQHVLPPLGFLKEARRVVVDYDEFLSNPYSQMIRISTRLGLPLPDRQNSMVNEFENKFLENGLRHTCFTENDLALDGRASPLVGAAYNLLRRLATDHESLDSLGVQHELDELNVRLKDALPAFDYIKVLEDGVLAERDTQINAYREQAERIVPQLHEARTRISRLERDVAERDLEVARLNQEVTEYTQRGVLAEEPRLPDGFEPDIYLKLNPDVAAAGMDPQVHYLQHGRRERRLYRLPATNVCRGDGAK